MGALVVDSSVLIALANPGDALHEKARDRAARWTARPLLLSTIGYSELLVEPARSGREARMVAWLDRIGIQVVPVDEEIARVAAGARAARRGLRLPDALVVATALVHDADLATMDRRMTAAHEALRG